MVVPSAPGRPASSGVIVQSYFSTSEVPNGFGPSVVTVGKFDGMHTGHRAVISRVLQVAHDRGLTSVVMTFDRNPLSLLRPARCPPALVSNAQKLELLASSGVDATLMVTFDAAFSAIPAAEFMRTILLDALHSEVVMVGRDFRFGAGGLGTVESLREFGASHGIEVIVIDDVSHDHSRRVSSTSVRELLADGRVAAAAELLGAHHTIRSVVVHGAERGRTLGYPTANLSPQMEGLVPADGVYAAWLIADGTRHPAAVSVGNNPTFGGVPERQVEAHALDASLDLYDKTVEVSFVDFVRGMRKFDGVEALTLQMADDERQVRAVLGVSPKAKVSP